MITAKELKKLSLLKLDNEALLFKLKDDFLDTVDRAYGEMEKNPVSRQAYSEKPLMQIDKDTDKKVIMEFAKFINQYGYFCYSDPVYSSYVVYFDDNICWNPYRVNVLGNSTVVFD